METRPLALGSWAEDLHRRAQQHRAARPQRWRSLGFDPPSSEPGPPPAHRSAWPRVSIVLATNRTGMLENCRRNLLSQDYPNLQIIIVVNDDACDDARVREMFAAAPDVAVVRVPQERNLGSCINFGARHASGTYITKMDDDDFYGPAYVSDLLLSALESRADITGKKATFFHFEDGGEYYLRSPELRHAWLWPVTDPSGCAILPPGFSPHGSNVAGATILVRRELLLRFPFDERAPRGTDSLFQLACRRAGLTIYASDEFNFCYRRRAGNVGHLWQVEKDTILKNAHILPAFDCGQLCV